MAIHYTTSGAYRAPVGGGQRRRPTRRRRRPGNRHQRWVLGLGTRPGVGALGAGEVSSGDCRAHASQNVDLRGPAAVGATIYVPGAPDPPAVSPPCSRPLRVDGATRLAEARTMQGQSTGVRSDHKAQPRGGAQDPSAAGAGSFKGLDGGDRKPGPYPPAWPPPPCPPPLCPFPPSPLPDPGGCGGEVGGAGDA